MKKLLTVFVILGCLLIAARLIGPSILDRAENHTLQPGPYHVSAEAEALHHTLLVADLHADSLLWGRNLLKAQPRRSHRSAADSSKAMSASRRLPYSPPFRAASISSATKTPATWCRISESCKAGRSRRHRQSERGRALPGRPPAEIRGGFQRRRWCCCGRAAMWITSSSSDRQDRTLSPLSLARKALNRSKATSPISMPSTMPASA